ncbi:MAG: tetratricopeptide repeat protein [Hyphomonadaceae bacterium]
MSDVAVDKRPERTQESPPARTEENVFEAGARSLAEFVVRAAVLPFTLLASKPSTILRAAESGNYRPLPSPFLLALITGVILSGAIRALGKLDLFSKSAGEDFLNAAMAFYGETDGMKAVLFALPYIAALWIVSGLISLVMGRGVKSAHALFACFAYCIAAFVEIVFLFALVALAGGQLAGGVPTIAHLGVPLAIALFFASKIVRVILLIRKQGGAPLAGAAAAVPLALLAMAAVGAIGGAITYQAFSTVWYRSGRTTAETYAAMAESMVRIKKYDEALSNYDQALLREPKDANLYRQRGEVFAMMGDHQRAIIDFDTAVRLKPEYDTAIAARRDSYLALGDYARAIADGDRLIESNPLYQHALTMRCRTRALWGEELDKALADCNEAVRLQPNIAWSITTRGFVRLRRHEAAAAFVDYDRAVNLVRDPGRNDGLRRARATALYGRGLAYLALGRADEGRADIAAAVALTPDVAAEFGSFAFNPNLPAPPPPALPAVSPP